MTRPIRESGTAWRWINAHPKHVIGAVAGLLTLGLGVAVTVAATRPRVETPYTYCDEKPDVRAETANGLALHCLYDSSGPHWRSVDHEGYVIIGDKCSPANQYAATKAGSLAVCWVSNRTTDLRWILA